MFSLSLAGRKSATFATFLVAATLGLSAFPSNNTTENMVLEASEATDDFFLAKNCEHSSGDSCGDIVMLEDFVSPKHKWVEMNDPGKFNAMRVQCDESSFVFRILL